MLSLGSLSNLSNKSFFPLYVLLTIQLSSYSLFFSLFSPDKPPKDVTLPKGDTGSRETIHLLATFPIKNMTESPILYLAQLFIIQNQIRLRSKVNITANQ